MFLNIPLLGLILLVDYTAGSCGKCQSNFVACHSETTFSLCVEGNPTDSVVTCPMDKVCTDQQDVCASQEDGSVPSCVTGCGVCNSYGKVFACVSQTEFAFCFGEDQPFYTEIGSCLDGYVCDLSSRTICVRDADSLPSCKDISFTTPDPNVSELPGDGSSTTTLNPTVSEIPGDGSSSTTSDISSTEPPGHGSSSTTSDSTVSEIPGDGTSSTTFDISSTELPEDGSSSTMPDISSTEPSGDGSSSTTLDPTVSEIPGDGSSSTTSDISSTEPPDDGSSSTTVDSTVSEIPGDGTSSTTSDISSTEPPGDGSSSTMPDISSTEPTGDGSSSTTSDISSTEPPGDGSSSTTLDPTVSEIPGDGSSSTTSDISSTEPSGDRSSSTTTDPTSTRPTTVETTMRAPRDATTFCSEIATSGTYKAEGDTTCTRYYICVASGGGYRGFEYTCTNSNYFNSETGLCQTEKPAECGGSGSSSTMPDISSTEPPGDGSSSTIPDVSSSEPPGDGSSSTTLDPTVSEIPGDGTSSTASDISSTEPSGDGSSSTTTDPTSTRPTTVETTTRAPRDATTFCSEIATSGTYKAEGDTTCTKYYICVASGGGYRGYEYTCTNSNYFNSETGLCQTEKPAECGGSGSSSTISDISSTKPPGDGSSSTIPNASSSEPPGDGSSSTTLDPTVSEIPGDGSSSTSSDISSTEPSGDRSSSTTTDPTSTRPTTVETTTRAPRDATTFCSEIATSGTYKAEGDTTCTRYYICVASGGGYRGYEYTCTNSNYFNSETGLCQTEKPAECGGSGSSSTISDISSTAPPGDGSSSTIPGISSSEAPGDGSSSTTLDPTVSEIPGDGSSSTTSDISSTGPPGDGSSSTTIDPTSTSPTTVETTTSAPRDATTFCSETATSGTYKAEGDTTCTRYYICVASGGGYRGFEYTCTNSNYFNSEAGLCQAEKPVECGGSGSSSTASDISSTEPPGDGSSSTTTDPTESNPTTRPPRDASTFCSETGALGTFKSETDTTCTKYYLCVAAGGFEYTCGNSNYFNSETGLCESGRPAECEGSEIVSTTPGPFATDATGDGSSSTTQDPIVTGPITVEPTTRAPRDAATFCSETGMSGNFSAEGDPTCTKYYLCLASGGSYTGYEYTCNNSNYFNSVTGQCQLTRPDNC